MATDVKLDAGDGTFVMIEARVLKAACSDLMLDSPQRRKENGKPNRRALVHDSQDGLTINFNGDYPGGVTIAGNASITGDLLLAGTALRTTLDDIRFDVNSAQRISTAISDRIDRMELAVNSLVELLGASIIPPWRTKTAIEKGSNEEAVGGGAAILSAAELELTIDFQFERQKPGFAHEDVISLSPPAGTAVKKGSTVVATVNLEG
jgi:hypothetical protein